MGVALVFVFFLIYTLKPEINVSETTEIVATMTEGEMTGQPQVGGAFQLVDHQGQQRTDADFKGKILLVYFGYSFCPDICPTALNHISQALNEMGRQASEFQPIFITIDPERDTVQNLALYMENYHPRFIALTGTPDALRQVMQAYRVYAQKAKPNETSVEYLMDHSSIVYVMDRQGRYLTSFDHQTKPDKIKEILKNYL